MKLCTDLSIKYSIAKKATRVTSLFVSVGLLGIEPSPPAPKAGILPVYYSPID